MKFIRYIAYFLLVVLTLFLAYTLLRKNHFIDKDIAIQQYQFENSQFVSWKDMEIHILEKGTQHNKSIILIHGLGGALHELNPLGDILAENFHVISFDLPGFGLSDAPKSETDIQDLYADFMDFILDNYAKDTCYIVGNSMGGLITWNTALEHPKRIEKIVLLAAAGYEMERIAEENAEWINQPTVKYLLAKGAAPLIAKSNVEMCFYDDSSISQYLIDRKYGMMNKKGNLDWLKQLASYKNFTDTALIKTINTPTLIIWGDKDEIIPLNHAYKFERDLPNNKLLIYENCGHAPMLEFLPTTAKDIQNFIKQ